MASNEAKQAVLDAIQSGNTTQPEIVEATALSRGGVYGALSELLDERVIEREKTGRSYVYGVVSGDEQTTATADPATATTTANDADADADDGDADDGDADADAETDAAAEAVTADFGETAVADADVDADPWADAHPNPADVTAYVPVKSELDELTIQVALRQEYDHRPVFLLTGPTGSGKTTLAENIASGKLAENLSDRVKDALGDKVPTETMPYFEVQIHDQMNAADLLGSPKIESGETIWQDGPATQAVRASRDGPVVLTLDEINRAPPQAKSPLFSLLDHRASVKLEGIEGGTLVKGDPSNLIIVATANIGTGHYTERFDIAEERRWKWTRSVDYLYAIDGDGSRDDTPAADFLVGETGVPRPFADRVVKLANEVADQADAQGHDTAIWKKIPLGTLKEFVREAQMNAAGGMPNPVVRAGEAAIGEVLAKPKDEPEMYDELVSLINGEFDGLDGVDPASVADFYDLDLDAADESFEDVDPDDVDGDDIGSLFDN